MKNAGNGTFETLDLKSSVRACSWIHYFERPSALGVIFSYVHLKNLTLHLEDVNFSKKSG